MKTLFLLFLSLSLVTTAYSQDDKPAGKEADDKTFEFNKKTDEFSDGTGVVFKLEKVKSMSFPGASNYYYTGKDGKRLVLITFRRYDDPMQRSQSNPSGMVVWYDMTFPGTDIPRCEIVNYPVKKIGKTIYQRKIIQNGQLNVEAAKTFSEETGTTRH